MLIDALNNINWTIIGVLVNGLLLLTTIAYVHVTQKQVAVAIKNQGRNEKFQENKIKNDTLIDLTRTWSSKDFILARNKASKALRHIGTLPDGDLYDCLNSIKCTGEEGDNAWVNVSLVSHFIGRIGKLLEDDKIDLDAARTEFSQQIDFWSRRLIPIWEQISEGERLCELIKIAHRTIKPDGKLSSYPYEGPPRIGGLS